MKHARQKIREAAAAALTGIASQVYTSRVYPLVNLPVISVYANNERSEMENDTLNTPRRYSRRLALEVEIVAEAVSDVDNSVDDLAAQVEAAMAADLTIAGTATDSELQAAQFEFDGGSDIPTVRARLGFEVWYRTTATDPENAL